MGDPYIINLNTACTLYRIPTMCLLTMQNALLTSNLKQDVLNSRYVLPHLKTQPLSILIASGCLDTE